MKKQLKHQLNTYMDTRSAEALQKDTEFLIDNGFVSRNSTSSVVNKILRDYAEFIDNIQKEQLKELPVNANILLATNPNYKNGLREKAEILDNLLNRAELNLKKSNDEYKEFFDEIVVNNDDTLTKMFEEWREKKKITKTNS